MEPCPLKHTLARIYSIYAQVYQITLKSVELFKRYKKKKKRRKEMHIKICASKASRQNLNQ